MVRVLTFNIRHGRGLDGRVDLRRVARVITASGAEVVALQEVDRHFDARSSFVDQAAWLADRLGAHMVYGATIDRAPPAPGAPRRRYGSAILSYHPVTDWRATPLPRPAGGERRILLEARIAVEGVPLRIACTHLQADSPVARMAQGARVRELLAGAREPVVLLGDFNAPPDAPEVVAFGAELADAWAGAGDGDGFTFDAATPHARIDYVMTSPGIGVRAVAVVPTDASDHLPVVADLVPW